MGGFLRDTIVSLHVFGRTGFPRIQEQYEFRDNILR